MPAASSSITVFRPAQSVFEFIARLENLPLYVPTLRKVVPHEHGHVIFEGEAKGRPYKIEGVLSLDDDAMSLSWGSTLRGNYFGALQVFDTEEGAELACRVECAEKVERIIQSAIHIDSMETWLAHKLDVVLAFIKAAVESGQQGHRRRA